MATLSLKISLDDGKVIKTIQFDPSTSIFDACKIIREKILEASASDPKDFGLFLSSEEDNKKGLWLELGRNLEYYMLRNGDIVEYKKKTRTLRVRMLDGSLKTMLVDDSQNVANLMVVICTKIGITNYDEYSLVREDIKDETDNFDNRSNYGTLTMKRKHAEKERDAKMDQLRKKLRTDDEVNWIDPSKTLREQGVDESETVLLRRKFFFSDQNIDSRDPVQLNLLYVQARDAILDGTHPVTLEKACEFAGIQCQIQFGDHKEDKHTSGFLDLKEFLPQSYAKMKGVEKKIFKEHKNHVGVSELDAKVLYTKTARALKTYGVAFFLVKEKMKGRNKLVPRLLGVTKDSVLRLDERTKEILQTWPLTTVRRWCASPNTFTLDFGDYSDHYYSVQTTEAEQILQVIAGYIDIILKKQKVKDYFGIEGDEGSTMVEDSVTPNKATIFQHETSKFDKVNTESLAKPAIMRAGPEGVKPYSQGHMAGAQYSTISGQVNLGHAPSTMQQTKITSVMSEPQRALISTISSGQEIIRKTERELVKAQLPELGSDPASIKWKEVTLDTNKQNVSSQIAAMNAATAQVVTLTSGPTDEVDHTAVGAAITTITSNLPEMTKGVKMIAALMDDNDNGDRLLEATRRLCTAFSDLLRTAEPETKEPRQSLLNAASRVGEASTQVLHTIGEDTEENREIQDMLLALAKAVANTTAALVLKAKNIAATCKDDQQAQNRVIAAATQCALATSQLVACAKVVAPTLSSPACREQVTGAAKQVEYSVRKLVTECERVAPAPNSALDDLAAAAADVTRALDDLLHHVNADRRQVKETIHETSVENIMSATDRLVSSRGDSTEMVRQARLLGQATAQLIQNIKLEAERQPDSETQKKLLAAAKMLADATAKMVEAARQCASSPHDKSKQEALCRAAEEIRYVTTDYASSTPDIKRQLFNRLSGAAKDAASTGTQLITAAHHAGVYNSNKHSQDTLVQECKILAEHIPRLIEGVKGTLTNPDDSNAQLHLINASEAFLQPGAHVAQAAKAVLPTVQDQASAMQLNNATQVFITSCSELRTAYGRARSSCAGLELDAAAQIIRSLQQELAEVDQAAREFRLKPLPGETAESASREITSASRVVGGASARLISAAQQGSTDYAGRAARDAAQALQDFAGAARGLVATAPHTRVKVIDSTQNVMSQSLMLIEEAKHYLSNLETSDITRLTSIAKNVSVALDHSVNSLPGHQDVDATIESINETLQILSMGEFPSTTKSYGQLQQELNVAAAGLTAAATETVQSVESPTHLGDTSKQFGRAYNELLGVSMEMAGQATDHELQSQMVMSMKNVSVESSKLLTTAKSVSNDPMQPNAKNKLSAAARAVTDSVNYLVDVCTSAAPGQKECDSAIRNIQSVRSLLQHPSEPVSDLGYFQCVETIIDQSKTLGDGMSGMANFAKISDPEQFSKSVKTVSESICGLIECTSQAAYLVAVSDPSSIAGRPGLVDQTQFARASQVIHQACTTIANPASNEQQVLSAATLIAKHTSALCNACRVASSKTTNPVAKRHFVQSAKEVANSTATLVKEIKALDNNYSETNRSKCASATTPLLDAVNSLCQFANSPEFVSVPARISTQARLAQEPILESGRKIIQSSCSMIESAKYLAVEPSDKSQWHGLAVHSRTVSDSIKSLVNNIRDKAPGQSECLAALDTLNTQLKEIYQASLMAASQSLPVKRGNSLQGYTEQMESSATEMVDKLEPLRAAAKFEAENLGHSVNQVVSYIEPLVTAAIGTASNMVDSQQQQNILDQTKTVIEGSTQLVLAAKEAGGNPRATVAHSDVDEYCQNIRDAVSDLLSNAESLSAQRGIVSGLVDSLTRSVTRITDHRMSLIGSFNEADSFVDYQTRMVGAAKEIARLATEMTAKSGTDASKLASLAGDLTHRYNQLAQDSIGAAATTTNNDVAQKIRSTVVELGGSVINLVNSGGLCQVSKDSNAQRQVTDHSKQVTEKVGAVLSALQAGSRGTQACIDAAATVAAIIGDLDTTILFASAGTLHAENENDIFADHRESILKTAKALVEDTKTLVGGAASSQEQLATAAQNAVSTIVQLSEVVKLGAMSLGSSNPDSQVMLIHAVRDVAAALKDLIQATKDASGKHIGDPAMTRLKDSAKMGLNGSSEDKRRWSLPVQIQLATNDKSRPEIYDVRSSSLGPPEHRKHDNGRHNSVSNYDSETDWFISDQEEELIRILEDSSQDEVENYEMQVEDLCNGAKKVGSVVSLNSSHTQWSYRNIVPLWKNDMEFRILRYAEMIVENECKKLEETVLRIDEEERNKTKLIQSAKFESLKNLDGEMKNIVRIINDIESENVVQKPKISVKVNKRKRIVLPAIGENVEQTSNSYLENIHTKEEYWQIFNIEAEIWKALFLKNYEKSLETKKKLEQFSGEELKLDEINALKEIKSKPIEPLNISPLTSVKKVKKVKLSHEFDNVIADLNDFSKRTFNFKGFDPIIQDLLNLCNLQLKRTKIKDESLVEAFDNIYADASDIENAELTFEELCKMEQHYEEIERLYRTYYEEEIINKLSNFNRNEQTPQQQVRFKVEKRDTGTQYNDDRTELLGNLKKITSKLENRRDIMENVERNTNIIRKIVLESAQQQQQNSVKEETDVFTRRIYNIPIQKEVDTVDLRINYPMQFYANNWWSIYDDIVKNRSEQFGTIDEWWKYYERIPKYDESSTQQPVMVTNVTSLLKTVKAVEDEHTRGTRALEATIEAIAQEIRVLLTPGAPKLTATPEELVRCTRAITVATAKAVAAGNSTKQDDVIAAANIGRRAIGDMLAICKGAAYKCAETEEMRTRTLNTGHEAANAYRELLQAVLKAVQGQTSARQSFPELGKSVAQAAADIVAIAELLKGSDWVDPDDPTVIAENELLGAAASIDAAANKLAALRPRKSVKEADETLNFDEMILEAAKSIIAATSALVRAASTAQRELIDQGKVARRPLHSSDDGQWSEGLVSAARLTAAAAHSLVESANALVQGLGSEERLISAAKQVAGSTAQLLVACKVKADPNSESTRRLQAAGNAVIKSTDNLVRAAQKAISHEEERCLVLNRRMVGGIAQEINARSDVLRIERQLEEARGRLNAIRQAKYKLKGGETSGDETDNEITIHSGYNLQDSRHSPYGTYSSTLYKTDGGYTSDSSVPGKNLSTSFGGFNSTLNQTNTSMNSTLNKSMTYSTNIEKTTKYPSPPPPNPPPPMTTNLSTFSRKIATSMSNTSADDKITKPVQNYEGFTTRSSNTSNTNYETRCYDTPRSLNTTPDFLDKVEEHKTFNESNAFSSYSSINQQKLESPRIMGSLEKPKQISSPLSPKFNAKFDLKREFESSDLSHNNYSQNILSVHDTKMEQIPSPTPYMYTVKSPTSPKPFSASDMIKTETYSQQSPYSTLTSTQSSPYRPGYTETNQSYSFKTETSNKPSTDVSVISPKSPNHESTHIFGKETSTYGGPNFSHESTTEVKEIPNGTQKITTTKIYSSTPMKITSTNMKYESSNVKHPQYDSMNDFNREFGSKFNTLDSSYSQATDTMKSFASETSNKSGTFMRPSDFQSDFQTVSKTVKSPSELAKELDAMERKLMKQTISSEVIEKKTVMTTSSKSETSSTTMKKFGNF